MNKKTDKKWYIILFFTMMIWGTQPPIIRSLKDISQFNVALINLTSGFIILLIFSIFSKTKLNIDKKDFSKIFVIGILLAMLPGVIINLGIQKTSSMVGSIIVNTNPIFVALLVMLFGIEKLDLKKLGLIILGFISMTFVVIGGKSSSLDVSYIGILYLFISALSIALGTVLSVQIIKKYGSFKTTFYLTTIGFIGILLMNIINGDIVQLFSLSLKQVLLASYMGIFTSALVVYVFNMSLLYIPTTNASIFKLFIPVFATTYGIIFLEEV